ncbi:DegT/DnrJ/EryC1/StrS family aminotransferase [Sphingomonas sp.]|jgi:dTDP-4-amino-4,6-dideoxygalactose transaminase|uniref:DegT/DnrJ/EryC1/StrS family aminotransferase n=1 Tax=Sphingomonas sp. TaxID=28214 RepID=UPI002E378E11|nr:DegT/DnrJ/EryC1/StrS family aminotransferase [Sphingomonas sp.]HEX4695443.1 DegT/DnrJ/EryC1/StrS family aminotransferase [Sphingomonas sp.]
MSSALPVPFFDWKALYAERADDYRRIFDETASAGEFILQRGVNEFEAALARYLGVKHVIGMSDCTNAMLIGLRAVGLRAGDEVIVPGHAFVAAAQSIHFAGGVPVAIELGDDWLIDPDAVRAAITPKTRAIMAVHVNGRTCDMAAIRKIADEHGLFVVEDAAQALGATLDRVPAGRFGDWGAFSFYPSKTLGCFGDAGALVTGDDAIAQTARAMRNHGAGRDKIISKDCAVWGTNARIDNLHAAILTFKLGWYDEVLERRRGIAKRYHEAFACIAELDLPPAPDGDPRRFDVFQNYEMCCDRRDLLRAHLATRGIGTIVQWGGVGIHDFANLGVGRPLPRTDRFFDRSLLVPMNHLLSDAQVDRVIDGVREFFT